ncbi:PREDICTED: annexin A7-like isoform X2 [Priapulus caudatus]|uniref:Annexin n=1 Tax=Priapulus caudatus TaxID=37621 RepID=A0ABM1E7R4_PRICU|nr:PREDICTED: annexin A7-like isoform X2 [Priapulus caudatus]
MSYPNPYGQQPAYPPGGGGGYPPQPGYPPAQSGYPPQVPYPPQQSYPPGGGPGYPPQQPGGYPPQPGYPQQQGGYPAAQPQYPQSGGYAGGPSGYPPQQTAGYPAQAVPGYPAQPAAGYPGHQPAAYPSQPAAGYPGQQSGGYPGQPPAGYPAQQSGGYPAQGQQTVQHGSPAQGASTVTTGMGKLNIGSGEVSHGTVVAIKPFDSENDAEILRKAMKGFGTDEKAIIDVITKRSNLQRQEIKKKFKTMYGKDLIKDLESELSGNLKELIMAMFTPTTYYDAWSLHEAMEGAGTKESVLIEILFTRTNAEIIEIVKCYKEHFRRDLEKDVKSETSGHFKRLLVSSLQGNRDELNASQAQALAMSGWQGVVDREKAAKEAKELYSAGEKKWGTDESTFNKILSLRHCYQLRATFDEYQKIAGRDITASIKREFSGDVEDGMLAIVECARNRAQYFTTRLYKAMKGLGTDDTTLIRVIVSRSEIDMVDIKKCFFPTYQKTLSKMVSSETSGDYKRLLDGLIGGE